MHNCLLLVFWVFFLGEGLFLINTLNFYFYFITYIFVSV